MIMIDEVKLFLRIDNDDEDTLLSSLLLTSVELVEGVIRQSVSAFETMPETIKQSILFCIATMYEQRQGGKDGLSMMALLDTIKRLCFAHRLEGF